VIASSGSRTSRADATVTSSARLSRQRRADGPGHCCPNRSATCSPGDVHARRQIGVAGQTQVLDVSPPRPDTAHDEADDENASPDPTAARTTGASSRRAGSFGRVARTSSHRPSDAGCSLIAEATASAAPPRIVVARDDTGPPTAATATAPKRSGKNMSMLPKRTPTAKAERTRPRPPSRARHRLWRAG